jgi:hypothetical protein
MSEPRLPSSDEAAGAEGGREQLARGNVAVRKHARASSSEVCGGAELDSDVLIQCPAVSLKDA